jgi:hypothetical protein
MVYFNSQLEIVDFVTDKSDAAPADAGKLVQQTSDVAWKKCVLPAVFSLAVAFYGGYLTGKYSNNQEEIHTAPVEEELPKEINTAPVEKELPKEINTAPVEKVLPKEIHTAPVEKELPKEDVPEKKVPVKENVAPSLQKDSVVLDQYEAKDSRVRTGAYRIVGTDHVEKVKTGDNLTRIAKRTIGPGMECYIEVFNDITSKTQLEAGQTIKIPKLERKKKKKPAAK